MARFNAGCNRYRVEYLYKWRASHPDLRGCPGAPGKRSPIVMVRKKNWQVWLCIEYRHLNLQTIKDAYSLKGFSVSHVFCFAADKGSLLCLVQIKPD